MTAFQILNPPRQTTETVDWPNLSGFALALSLLTFSKRAGGLVCVIAPDAYSARVLRDDLAALNDVPVDVFPDWEILPYDLYSPHPDLISRRLDLLSRLPSATAGIVIISMTALMQRLPPTQWISSQSLSLQVGTQLGLDAFREELVDAGYVSTDQVWQPGQYACRGSVIDLWPMGQTSHPFRVELFDEEIESIRTFDPDSQRSVEKINEVILLPAQEYPYDPTARSAFKKRFRLRFEIDVRKSTLYNEVSEGVHAQGIEQYLPLFFDEMQTFFDYLPKPHRLVLLAGTEEASYAFHHQIHHRFDQRQGDIERPILTPSELYVPADNLMEWLQSRTSVRLRQAHSASDIVLCPPQIDLAHPETLKATLDQCRGRVLMSVDTPSRREIIARALRASKQPFDTVDSWHAFLSSESPVSVMTLPISRGLMLPEEQLTIFSEAECFPGHTRTRQRKERVSTQDPETLIKSLADLQPGAPVVHLEHGIGRYQGLIVLKTDQQVGEFLTIMYADGDLLYVPVTDLSLVSRYTGVDPETVTLHRLGSDQWKKVRRKAAERVRDVAAELLHLQARRQARTNDPIAVDQTMYAQFAAGFEYDETQDQLNAIEAVVSDLNSEQPMDRVVCGDVGFGKTEVALRAAFLVAQAGRQVAVLAPTTLLAEQHYQQFCDRFADWPINIALLSRNSKASKQVLTGLADGTIDIVIGTHRLLQPDIKFNQLNLVVIDEEQRFGVRQKEQLKKLRAEVNLLTLTATPIPRTLNMAMSGLRELSIIATPPQNRLAIKTFVSEWDPDIIRDAVTREFQRGGQVYFLHNEVKTMPKVVADLEKLFPDARIGMAHGQMPSTELEATMRDFYSRRINLLVCSTIIENGIDVPSANTIIIQRADKFGLGQLHQLRGRVGRSHHLAFAHLITPPWRALTKDAQKRLEAISSMEALGAGFMLASHDLEIRGAGELLGEDQSGQIQAIGFSLYSDLLKRAVSALKTGKEPDLDEPLSTASDIDLHTTALIPEDYLPDIHQRLVFYKKIAQTESEQSIYDLEVEMIDRFGLLPESLRHLFNAARLRLQATAMGIKKLEVGPLGGRIEFNEKPDIKMSEFIQMIQQESHTFQMPAPNRLRVKGDYPTYEDRLELAHEILSRLAINEVAHH